PDSTTSTSSTMSAAAVMAKLELSLDDIIAKSRLNKKKNMSKKVVSVRTSVKPLRRVGGDARKALSENVPSGKWKRDLYSDIDAPSETETSASGKWKHDLFETVNSPTTKDVSGKWKHDLFSTLESTAGPRDSGFRAQGSDVTFNKKVRISISNLAPTVTKPDLKELFSPYPVDSAFVHYGQNKLHLGTGEVTMKKNDAHRALKELDGVAIDGSELTMVIVGGGSIFDRVQMIKKVDGGKVQKRPAKPRMVRSEKKPYGNRHPLDRTDENTQSNSLVERATNV
ncbi:hypothetical protein PRIPAC_75349, partial [Pristionchus pacificus]